MSPIRLRRTLPAVTLLTALLFTPHPGPGPAVRAGPAGRRGSSSFLGAFGISHQLLGGGGGSIAPWAVKNLSRSNAQPLGGRGPSIDPWGGHAAPPTAAALPVVRSTQRLDPSRGRSSAPKFSSPGVTNFASAVTYL